jgi:hypothetical protein
MPAESPVANQSGKLMPAVEACEMKRRKQIAVVAGLAWSCTIGFMLIACQASSARAEQTPPKRCASIAKQEYDAARRQNMLRSRYGDYVRTGGIGRRQYWYCHA